MKLIAIRTFAVRALKEASETVAWLVNNLRSL